jgi:hypothetical protein
MRFGHSLLFAAVLAACGSSKGGSTGGGNVTVGGNDGTPPSVGGSVDPLPYGFRYGVNNGHRNGSWGDDKEATLGSRAGVRSLRVKLPAMHFKTWGYDIEVGDIQTYAKLGMHDHIGFLIGSETVGQTVAPAGSADWRNEYYIPKNLYEPIFLDDGSVNPNNYWGAYVYRTVSTYKPWVHVWHVWNEPDWTPDWRVVDKWKTDPPAAANLPRFNGSIFDYIRMLRVTWQAAKKADPDALVATGGLGYAPFLDAILRYTDNPQGGEVTAAFPAKGGAYIDVIDFHYYPIFSPKSSDASVDDFIKSKNDLAAVLAARGKAVRGWNVSENGAPLAETTGYPNVGSPEYARNYLIKMMTTAQANGIGGVDWFILSNGEEASDDVFAHMGLYNDIASLTSVDQATKTDICKAYTTLTQILEGAAYDDAATKALGPPAGVRGVAFAKDGRRRLVLWAATPANAETASANVDVATTAGFDVYAWDGAKSSAAANGGKVSMALSGSPVFLVEH